MRLFVITVAAIILMLYPGRSDADNVVLKNGRKINAAKCWEDGDLIRCNLYGQIVSYPKDEVANLTVESSPEKPTDGFIFDIWRSGLKVRDAIDIAETHNKPLHKDGLLSINKTFNPKMWRPYEDSAFFYLQRRISASVFSIYSEFFKRSLPTLHAQMPRSSKIS
jgi:hypothetical protein